MSRTNDPFDLERFVEAQAINYDDALRELRAGEKRSHWMWYVFPQIEGLGYSAMSQRYAIKSIDEAKAYLAHPVLGVRLRECFAAVNDIAGKTANEIFGPPDDMKLRSCATLFSYVSKEPIFQQVIDKYFGGVQDDATLRQLKAK